jgi:hypothetical protein
MTIYFSDHQVKNCQLSSLIRLCRYLNSHGKFDIDYLETLSRVQLIAGLKAHGYVYEKTGWY